MSNPAREFPFFPILALEAKRKPQRVVHAPGNNKIDRLTIDRGCNKRWLADNQAVANLRPNSMKRFRKWRTQCSCRTDRNRRHGCRYRLQAIFQILHFDVPI